MFAPMTKICRLLGVGLLALAACKDSSEGAFLSLADLCQARSELLCDALADCCDPPPAGDCLDREKAACEQERASLVQNSRRSYDSEAASRRLDDQRAQSSSCGEAIPLASYFSGGQTDGGSCDEHADCVSGSCDQEAGLCVEQTRALGDYCQPETE